MCGRPSNQVLLNFVWGHHASVQFVEALEMIQGVGGG